jgi:hypothetical protein
MDSNNTENNPVVIAPIDVDIEPEEKSTEKSSIPPLFSFSITNPLTYIQAWWKKIIGNEGVKLTLQIKPLTAVTLMLVFSGVGFGFGRITVPPPLAQFIPVYPSPTPIPSPNPWKETAFTGKLTFTKPNNYFLVTTSAEAISLTVPSAINLTNLVGKRIMVTGNYNKTTKQMVVSDTADMEILPTTKQPIPTVKPSPIP